MKHFAKFAAVAALTLSASAFAVSANAADVNIATSGNPESHPELKYTPVAGTSYGTIATLANVSATLTFDDPSLAAYNNSYAFAMSLTANSSSGGGFSSDGSTYLLSGLDGNFTFKNASNVVILGGHIEDGWLKAAAGAGGANIDMNLTPPTYYSQIASVQAFLDTLHSLSFGFTLTGVSPRISITNDVNNVPQNFAAFTANTAAGSFDGVVPEPATWGLMLVGFGGLGAMLRLNRKRQALAAV